jgi:two-component system chemotaxis response regulator CheB
MIDAEPLLEVVDTARTREELLFKASSAKPDLIVTQFALTKEGSLPLFTSVYGEDTPFLLMVSEQLAGNATYVSSNWVKGKSAFSSEGNKFAGNDEVKLGLLSKLRELTGESADPSVIRKGTFRVKYTEPSFIAPPAGDLPLNVVVIGASTGGSAAIEYLVKDLDFLPPTVILVAVHMPEKFTRRLARRLQKFTDWRVEEGCQGMKLMPHTIVIAPGGQNMRVRSKTLRPQQLTVELAPSNFPDSPSVDVLMQSAAQCAQEHVLGVILTGMGQDGTAGAKEILKHGGSVIAQNQESSAIFGMAKSAIEHGVVNGVFAIGQINAIINRFVLNRQRSHAIQRKLIG